MGRESFAASNARAKREKISRREGSEFRPPEINPLFLSISLSHCIHELLNVSLLTLALRLFQRFWILQSDVLVLALLLDIIRCLIPNTVSLSLSSMKRMSEFQVNPPRSYSTVIIPHEQTPHSSFRNHVNRNQSRTFQIIRSITIQTPTDTAIFIIAGMFPSADSVSPGGGADLICSRICR